MIVMMVGMMMMMMVGMMMMMMMMMVGMMMMMMITVTLQGLAHIQGARRDVHERQEEGVLVVVVLLSSQLC